MYVECLVSILVVGFLYHRWSLRKFLAKVANMDGPPALPLLGHAYLMLKYTSTEEIFRYVCSMGGIYRCPVFLDVGTMKSVFLTSPEYMQIVLNSPHCLSKSRQYECFDINRGLVTCPGYLWKGLRKQVSPSFGNAMVASFVNIFNEKSAIFVQNLTKHVGQGQTDISIEVAKCFLDMVFPTAFGVDFDLQRTLEGDEIAIVEDDYFDFAAKRAFLPFQYIEYVYKLSKDYKMFHEKLAVFHALSLKVLKTKSESELSQIGGDLEQSDEEIINGKKPKLFLDSLIDLARLSEKFTQEDIIENFITIIVAGSETTASTLKIVLLMLAIHQDVQERVYQEILQVCPDKDQSVSLEGISALSYTEMVCKESLRLYPVGPFIGRKVSQDIKLDAKYTIPATSEVFLNILYLHHNPAIWGPDVERFNPDRFLPENSAQRHPYAFLPFSAGPRNCLGMRYAWVSMKIFLVHVLRRYRLKTTLAMDDIKIKPSLVLRTTNGCPILLVERI